MMRAPVTGSLTVNGHEYRFWPIADVPGLGRLPFVLRILLENQLRHRRVHDAAAWVALVLRRVTGQILADLAFSPSRVIMQDFTSLPVLADLAAMRDAMAALGRPAGDVQLRVPGQLVIDHSLAADRYGRASAMDENIALEYQRNAERYQFFKWAKQAFPGLAIVPPGQGIVHQVNLEYLAEVVTARDGVIFPDTIVGTDSHTTMANGLGVLGWGVGGIEAELALLGEPLGISLTGVVGCRLHGTLGDGVTTTDLLLSITELLRSTGVVGRMIEFFGPSVPGLTVAERASISNMSPEYGATCAYFPVDEQTLDYLRETGRTDEHIRLVEAYARRQRLWRGSDGGPDSGADEAVEYDSVVELDLGTVRPSLAGPRRPQDRISLSELPATTGVSPGAAPLAIAAITSCTNTSNPALIIGAGLLARNAVAAGLRRKPRVKTSLAPGSRVVMRYLRETGLDIPLEKLGFYLVGYGCTTCAGNSGELDRDLVAEAEAGGLRLGAVLSGNRNFESRIHPQVDLAYLASPALVVAFAIAGRVDVDLTAEPLGTDEHGRPVFLRDIWPAQSEIAKVISDSMRSDLFVSEYGSVFDGDEQWAALAAPDGDVFPWDQGSAYVTKPPFFDSPARQPAEDGVLPGLRTLVWLGDSVTTDHISPAGHIAASSPAGRYLRASGVPPEDFNVYGARRGNHEVMIRGTFANSRLKNKLAGEVTGGVTIDPGTGGVVSIFDAAMSYRDRGIPLMVIAGREYGCGSSRDWAAKGSALLGVRVVLARSFERIHRSNLVGMGVLPLEFPEGQSAESLGMTGDEEWAVTLADRTPSGVPRHAVVSSPAITFTARCRIDNDLEWSYYTHGGALNYVLAKASGQERPAG